MRTHSHIITLILLLICRGILGEPGSSAFMFDHKGVIRVPCSEIDASTDVLELAIEAGAEDIHSDDVFDRDSGEKQSESTNSDSSVEPSDEQPCVRFICDHSELTTVSKSLQSRGYTIALASLEYLPKSLVHLDQDSYEKAMKLVCALSEHNNVTDVYDNFTLVSTETGSEL